MILFEDIVKEKIDYRVTWKGSSYDFAKNYSFPLTPKIASLINNEKSDFFAAHITSVDMLENLIKISNSKKSISCTTKPSRMLRFSNKSIMGVHHSGVLAIVRGNLILRASADIMSIPDESGRRWIERLGDLYQAEFLDKRYIEYLHSHVEYLNLQNDYKNKNAFVKLHIDLTQKFLQDENNLTDLLYILSEEVHGDKNQNYDEILLNKIRIESLVIDSRDIPDVQYFNSYDREVLIREYIKKLHPHVYGPIDIINDPSEKGEKDNKKIISRVLHRYGLDN